MRQHIDDIVVPFKQAEAIATELRVVVPHDALDFLVLAWHHDHLIYQSGAKQKGYHQKERDFWLACAQGLLGNEFDTLKALVFDKLDTIVRASSLVEMVNALIRPYLNSCNGTLDRKALRGAVVGAFTSTDQHRAGPDRPWHNALKAAAATGDQQRSVYGSTGDCFRTNDRRPYRRYRERSPTRGL
jgi:hypothetical protein